MKKSKKTFIKSALPVTFAPSAATVATLLQQALALHQAGKIAEAEQQYRNILAKEPAHAAALGLLGAACIQQNKLEEALQYLNQAIAINPNDANTYSNRGLVLFLLKQHKKALESFNRALECNPNHFDAYLNIGATFLELNKHQEALEIFNRALKLNPHHAGAYSNRGLVFLGLKQHKKALENFNRALELDSKHIDAYLNRGNTFFRLKMYRESLKNFNHVLQLNPQSFWVYGDAIKSKYHICDWSHFDREIELLKEKIANHEKTTTSFSALNLFDSSSLHRKAAEIWVKEKHPFNLELGSIPRRFANSKIRIGYFSSDFHGNHPIANVIAELFELHNKSRFEIIAFSFGADTQDVLRQRIVNAFDQFIDVRDRTDKEIAQLARQLSIDIAVDLNGFTADNRFGIFSYRAAPIQVCYLGYPGTVGADYMDYIIADPIVIPQESQIHYSGKIAYLPHCYQVNDRKRVISNRVFTREELGLPESGFVFCCFNNNYKITPSVFDSWMRILHQVPDSVLWLVKDNDIAAENLLKEAQQRGIDAKRIIFAQRVPLTEDYLARNRIADLFLDTLPYNAHSTASDALWAGLPVLTRMGESFASRVAGSLLHAIHLPELITTTAAEFEAKAVELALNPEKLQAIREKLHQNRLTTPLFDSELFTRHLENAYEQMMQRYYCGLSPDHLVIPPLNP